jgi:DNA-binding response OmpR family regulator
MLKVMIAEDDLMLADMAEETLSQHGYDVCGIGQTVAEAVALGLRHKPDLAIIDLRLADGGFGTDVAARLNCLEKLGILYATANLSQVALTNARGDAVLSKPYRSSELLRSLELVMEIIATGTASPPLPRGFQMLYKPAKSTDKTASV